MINTNDDEIAKLKKYYGKIKQYVSTQREVAAKANRNNLSAKDLRIVSLYGNLKQKFSLEFEGTIASLWGNKVFSQLIGETQKQVNGALLENKQYPGFSGFDPTFFETYKENIKHLLSQHKLDQHYPLEIMNTFQSIHDHVTDPNAKNPAKVPQSENNTGWSTDPKGNIYIRTSWGPGSKSPEKVYCLNTNQYVSEIHEKWRAELPEIIKDFENGTFSSDSRFGFLNQLLENGRFEKSIILELLKSEVAHNKPLELLTTLKQIAGFKKGGKFYLHQVSSNNLGWSTDKNGHVYIRTGLVKGKGSSKKATEEICLNTGKKYASVAIIGHEAIADALRGNENAKRLKENGVQNVLKAALCEYNVKTRSGKKVGKLVLRLPLKAESVENLMQKKTHSQSI